MLNTSIIHQWNANQNVTWTLKKHLHTRSLNPNLWDALTWVVCMLFHHIRTTRYMQIDCNIFMWTFVQPPYVNFLANLCTNYELWIVTIVVRTFFHATSLDVHLTFYFTWPPWSYASCTTSMTFLQTTSFELCNSCELHACCPLF